MKIRFKKLPKRHWLYGTFRFNIYSNNAVEYVESYVFYFFIIQLYWKHDYK